MDTNRPMENKKFASKNAPDLDSFDDTKVSSNTKQILRIILVLWVAHSAVELYAYVGEAALWQYALISLAFPIALLTIVYAFIREIRISRDVHIASLIFVLLTICRLSITVVREVPNFNETAFVGPDGEWTILVTKVLNAGSGFVCSLVAAFCMAIVLLRHSRQRGNEQAKDLKDLERQRDQIQSSAESKERYFQAVYDVVPDVIFIKDVDGHYLSANSAAERVFKVNRSESTGKNDAQLFGEEIGKEVSVMDQRVLKGETVEQDFRRNIEGDDRVFHVIKAPLRGSNGEIKGLCGITRDITERVQMEEERRRLQTELMQTQKLESMEVLAGGIAHDFNNLLTGILGHLNVLLADVPDDSSEHDRLREVKVATEAAADLSQQMLLYSGRLRLNIEACDLNHVVQKTWNELGDDTIASINIGWSLPDDLRSIQADREQICNVLTSVFFNSIESMEAESGAITVKTSSLTLKQGDDVSLFSERKVEPGDYVVVEVTDNGCGMDSDSLGKIFDPFYSTKFVGRGLGMAAVYGIVRSHQGSIKVESELGVGTVVRLLLPLVQKQIEISTANAYMSARMGFAKRANRKKLIRQRDRIRNEQLSTKRETVLMVDDEEIVLNATTKVLNRVGYSVLAADSGARALELFQERQAEVSMVLLDLSMPTMTGEEVFTEIRNIDQDVPILFTSGYDIESIGVKLADDGVTGFLPKPFTPETLIAGINQLLNPI